MQISNEQALEEIQSLQKYTVLFSANVVYISKRNQKPFVRADRVQAAS